MSHCLLLDFQQCAQGESNRFERLHPRPEWASLRVKSGTQSLSSLLSSTKSFIASNDSHPDSVLSSLGKKKRGPLKSGTVDLQRLLDANHHNPTTGKKQASNAGNGVVDVVWHPSQKVSVMAVAGGDRRVRFFNVRGSISSILYLPDGIACCRSTDTRILLS